MKEETEKVRAIRDIIKEFDDVFNDTPGMLGAPEEIYAMFFYLDKIRFVLEESSDFDDFDKSWLGFLMHKKIIVGAANQLLENLKCGKSGYEDLKKLRKEYFSWRNRIRD
ncbi:MAG: hypothetical protein E6Q88_13900 [Lysobacteraceae bacterium]|nr:MAG: hypothetical protein E6Q88_13900 [Xanthomonadaceae bacterium]